MTTAGDDFASSHSYRGLPFDRPLTGDATLHGRMREWARTRARDTYLVAVAADGVRRTLTYGELDRSSRNLAAWLRREAGLRPGDIVALLPRNDIPSVVTIFALMRAGCPIFFINPAEPEKRLEELLGALPVRATLAPTPEVAAQQPAATGVPDPASLDDAGPDHDDAPPGPGDGSFFFGTSGSTAASKIVRQALCNATVNAEALRLHHGLGPGIRLLGCLPIHHVNGLHFTLFATLWSGGEAMLLETFNPIRYRQCVDEYQPHIASVVPSILQSLVLASRGRKFPPGFRYFVSAAAPLPARVCASVMDSLGARVLQGYGLTETTNFSAKMPDGLSEAAYRRLMMDCEIPSIGIAVPGNEVAVLKPDGSRCAPGEIGEICMRGHNVMLGYANNEAGTREAFAHGWFHSQDLGYEILDEETGHSFFVVTGRLKNMAKVMGVAVSLEEMERTLLKLPQVADAACFSVPDEMMGEAIVAVIVSADDIDTGRITAHLEDYFGAACLPSRFIRAESVPRTATGKIIRAQLPKLMAR
jgi:acyl-CoA synthetase (AMP-forming)/AMP-acid ligase II